MVIKNKLYKPDKIKRKLFYKCFDCENLMIFEKAFITTDWWNRRREVYCIECAKKFRSANDLLSQEKSRKVKS